MLPSDGGCISKYKCSSSDCSSGCSSGSAYNGLAKPMEYKHLNACNQYTTSVQLPVVALVLVVSLLVLVPLLNVLSNEMLSSGDM